MDNYTETRWGQSNSVGYIFITPVSPLLLHVSLSWVFLVSITHHIWTRKVGGGGWLCVCECPCALCVWYFVSYPLPLPSTCFYSIFSVRGGGVKYSLSKTIPSLVLSLAKILDILSVYHIFCLFSCHFLCCVVCCCVLCSFSLEVYGERLVSTMYHIPLPLRHTPSYSTNGTHIHHNHRYPLYILFAIVGIPTNDLMSIVVNIIGGTLHGKNRVVFFQVDHQLFKAK